MSHYTITEPGNRALSRRKTGHTTRFEGAMLSTLYHSRLHVCLYLLNAAIPHSSCVARNMNYTKQTQQQRSLATKRPQWIPSTQHQALCWRSSAQRRKGRKRRKDCGLVLGLKMQGRCCHISTKVVSIILLHFLSFSLLAFFLLLIAFIFAVVTYSYSAQCSEVSW